MIFFHRCNPVKLVALYSDASRTLKLFCLQLMFSEAGHSIKTSDAQHRPDRGIFSCPILQPQPYAVNRDGAVRHRRLETLAQRHSPRSGRKIVGRYAGCGFRVRGKPPSLRGAKEAILAAILHRHARAVADDNGIAPLPLAVIPFAPVGARAGWGADFPAACAVGCDLPPATRAGPTP